MNHAHTPTRHRLPGIFRLAALAASLTFGLAHADEYSDVNQLLRSGKLVEASAKADQYLAGKPRDPQMRFLKGVIQSESGKPTEAISTFTKLTEDFPELPEPYNNLAVLYAGQSQFDKARTALEMAIRTNPSYATAHENLGDVYAKLASQAYSKALQLDANNTGSAAQAGPDPRPVCHALQAKGGKRRLPLWQRHLLQSWRPRPRPGPVTPAPAPGAAQPWPAKRPCGGCRTRSRAGACCTGRAGRRRRERGGSRRCAPGPPPGPPRT